MVNEISDYSLKQNCYYIGLFILNDTLRLFNANPVTLLDHHLGDFSYAAFLTSFYYTVRPQDKDSKVRQIASIVVPTAILSAYELASKNPDVFGTYDPKDIPAYALGSISAYIGVKLFSTKESRAKIKEFLKKINPFSRRNLEEKNLENIVIE